MFSEMRQSREWDKLANQANPKIKVIYKTHTKQICKIAHGLEKMKQFLKE